MSVRACNAAILAGFVLATHCASTSTRSERPNFVLVVCDNLGYADIEPFGSKLHRTPNLNRLADQGMRFTHFYAASGVCTPSRAALLTGCYPRRVGMDVTDGAVLRPVSSIGLNPDELTIAELLDRAGYATAIFGKWHLGDQPVFLPTRQGFDTYLGTPYSDDMTPRAGKNWPPLPLMRDEKVIEAPVDRDLLTARLTAAAVDWIEQHRDEPFFLYMPQSTPGSTRTPFAGPRFKGKSKNGAWGDSVEELDWSLGEVMRTLSRLGLDERTLVIWTSDNGAPRRDPPQGLNTPLAGWGYTTAEGGMRVPCIMRWPGVIPAGNECAELATMMDLLPTFARQASVPLPDDRRIDGRDITSLMTTPGATSPHEAFYYYQTDQLQAVRSGRWKLYVPLAAAASKPNATSTPARLYDVVSDPGESHDQAANKPEVVSRLEELAERARDDLGDRNLPGKHVRPAGRVPNPTPRLLEAGT